MVIVQEFGNLLVSFRSYEFKICAGFTIYFLISDKLVNNYLPVVRCEIESLKRFISVRDPPKKKYVIHEQVLQHIWQLFDQQLIDIPTFFSCANHILRIFNNPLILKNLEEVDYLVNAEVHNISKSI